MLSRSSALRDRPAARFRSPAVAVALLAGLTGCTAGPIAPPPSHHEVAATSASSDANASDCEALAVVLTEYDTWTKIEPPASYAAAWAVTPPVCVVAPEGGRFFTVLFAQPADKVSAALLAAGWKVSPDVSAPVAASHTLGPLDLTLEANGPAMATDPDISGAFKVDLSNYSAWVGSF